MAGLKGYNNMVEAEKRGERRVNRPRWEGEVERRFKKLGAKSSWFKRKRKRGNQRQNQRGGKNKGDKTRGKEEESQIETVLFVPNTPNGLLAKMIQEEDDNFRKGTKMKRMKVVESRGTTVLSLLSCTNPWAKDGCEREDCFPCMGEKGRGGNCQQENVVYRISCLECGARQVKAEYTGESSRTAYLRGREHLEGLESQDDDNALWKHCALQHDGRKVKFMMKVLRSHKSPLTRQIHESVEIDSSTANIVMNSKGVERVPDPQGHDSSWRGSARRGGKCLVKEQEEDRNCQEEHLEKERRKLECR